MKRLFIGAAIAAAITIPSIAVVAQTAGPMGAKSLSANAATNPPWVCRAPLSSDPAANSTVSGTAMYCRPINITRVRAAFKNIQDMMKKQATAAQPMTAADQQAMAAQVQKQATAAYVAAFPGFPGF